MKPYRVAEARAQFGTLLDEAEAGDAVVIERNGTRFRLAIESVSKSAARTPAAIAHADPDVLSGSWTWTSGRSGLRFRPRRRKP